MKQGKKKMHKKIFYSKEENYAYDNDSDNDSDSK